MDKLQNYYNKLTQSCNKKRNRNAKSLHFENKTLKKRKVLSNYREYVSSAVYSDTYLPTTSENLFKELINDPNSIEDLRNLVKMLNEVLEKTQEFLKKPSKENLT